MITSGGTSALRLLGQCLGDPGDAVLVLGPHDPEFTVALGERGAGLRLVSVTLAAWGEAAVSTVPTQFPLVTRGAYVTLLQCRHLSSNLCLGSPTKNARGAPRIDSRDG